MPSIMLNDHNIHYLDEGNGDTPVILVHTFPLDSGMWQPQVRHLGSSFRVIAPDLAGLGASDPPTEPAGYSVESWADDVIGLCGALGFDHVTALVGASLGADVSLAVARRARDLPASLVLAGLRPRPPSPDEERHWAEQQQWVAGGGDVGSIIDRFVDTLLASESSRRGEAAKLARIMMGHTSANGWAGGFEVLRNRPDPTPDVDKLDVPVVLVAGEHDGIAAPGDVRDLAAAIPGGGFVEVPDAGHLPNLENPAIFNQVLDELLAGRQSRRPRGKHSWPAAPATTR